jgi:hypothetical protein
MGKSQTGQIVLKDLDSNTLRYMSEDFVFEKYGYNHLTCQTLPEWPRFLWTLLSASLIISMLSCIIFAVISL